MTLQDQRKQAGLSQSKLAEASGIKLRTIQQYENGQRNIDGGRLEILCSLAAALGCTLFDILESDDLKDKLKSTV